MWLAVAGLEQQCRCAVDVGCGWQLHGWNDNVGVQYVDLGVAGRTGAKSLMPAWVLE